MHHGLFHYIETMLARGFSEAHIIGRLIESGWQKSHIEDALAFTKKKRVFLARRGEPRAAEPVVDVHIFRRHVPTAIVALVMIVIVSSFALTAIAYRRGTDALPAFPAVSVPETALLYGSWPALENADFFGKVKQTFIAEKRSFIESDLSAMKLRLYKNGAVAKEVNILSKGREGSWWETPAGIYRIQAKEEDHFSSFGGVHMPWSMPFQGNFFIHGWPFYPDGTPVESTYSGGCIRLSTEDAGAIFKEAEIGMPILVYEHDFQGDEFRYEPRVPLVDAAGYLVADLHSNVVVAEKSSKEILSIASLTKLMTALVATEYVNIEKEVVIPKEAIVETTRPRLKSGQRVSVFDLLYPLLMESSNEAAEAIAHALGKERFVELMNEKAKAIGMENTRFVDPSGVAADNVSTAQDLFQLAKYLYNNRSFILDISTGKLTKTAYGSPSFTNLENFNIFHTRDDFVGGKTGKSTSAEETLLSIFDLPVQGTSRPIVFILLGSLDDVAEGQRLFAWFRNNY